MLKFHWVTIGVSSSKNEYLGSFDSLLLQATIPNERMRYFKIVSFRICIFDIIYNG